MRFCRGALPSRVSGDAFLSRGFASVHTCCLPHGDKQDGLRYAPFLFRRVEIAICAFSICRCGYLPLWVHFWFGRFFVAISTECRRRGWRRGVCTLLRDHIGLEMLSAGSTLGLRAPNLRQRVFDSLDSLHAAAELCWCVYVPSPGYTERPAELQFMVRRVVLYNDDINSLYRPDSSRPQAAKSRVACALAVWKPALPAVTRV